VYAENRKRIDATTPRRSFVADPVKVEVDGYPFDLAEVTMPNHPDRSDLGTRPVRAGPAFYLAHADLAAHAGEEVRLKDLVNVRLPPEIPPAEGVVRATFTSRPNQRLPRLQWVGEPGAIPVDVLAIDGSHRRGVGEISLLGARPRETYQFERFGFVRVEGDWATGTQPVRVVYAHP